MTRLWRWQQDLEPGTPWQNMALDAGLLASLRHEDAVPVIRLYRWDRPAVSFGRLQNEVAVSHLYPDRPCVRRPTGGRAVLHGEDLTVSVATQTDWLPEGSGSGVLGSYHQILRGVTLALGRLDVPVGYGRLRRGEPAGVNCFDAAGDCDLIDPRDGRKILGSAQRREGTALLQQMSLPLLGLPPVGELCAALQEAFGEALKIEGWLTIDTPRTVWYTGNDKSKGERSWRVKS